MFFIHQQRQNSKTTSTIQQAKPDKSGGWAVRWQEHFGALSCAWTAEKKSGLTERADARARHSLNTKREFKVNFPVMYVFLYGGLLMQCIKERGGSLTFKCDRQNVLFLPLSHRALFTDEAYESGFLPRTGGAGRREAPRHKLTGTVSSGEQLQVSAA